VIAAEECSASLLAEAADVLDVARGERPGNVRADEPQLLIGAAGELREVDIIARCILRTVARRNFYPRGP
jgi:hypothetical protein